MARKGKVAPEGQSDAGSPSAAVAAADTAFVRWIADDAPYRKGMAQRVRQCEAEKFIRHGVAVLVGD